jgi:HPt (histidine-containing phosphotransfer) domain-containing protein
VLLDVLASNYIKSANGEYLTYSSNNTLPPLHVQKTKESPEPVTAPSNNVDDSSSIDKQTLRQFQQDMGGNINPILTKFHNKLPNYLGAISDAVKDRQPDELSKRAHKLKGTAATFGAKKLSAVAYQLEILGKSGSVADDGKLLDSIMKEGKSVEMELEKIIADE